MSPPRQSMFVFSLVAYRRVFSVCSAEEEPGAMHTIMMILALLSMNESRSVRVNLDALNGTCTC